MTHERNSNGIAFFEDGPADAPVVVLGHALGADHRIWEQVTERLSEKYRVIRWDLPGHGSSATLSSPLTMDHISDLVVEGLAAMGVDRFHLGGISLGGMASLATAAKYPERILSVAVLDAGPVLLPSSMWNERAQLVRAEGTAAIVDATMSRWFTEDFYLGRGKTVSAEVRRSYVDCDREGFARCCEVIANTDLRSQLDKVTARTLLLTGDQDAGMTPKELEEMASAMNTSVTQVIVPDAKHLTCVEQPEAVAEALERLFAQK